MSSNREEPQNFSCLSSCLRRGAGYSSALWVFSELA